MAVSEEQQRQAAIDFNKKLELEAGLKSSLLTLDRKTARALARSLGTVGVMPDFEGTLVPELEPLLGEHYDKVANVFGRSTSDQIPAELFPSEEELAIIASVLGTLIGSRAEAQARIIARTTAKDAERAVTIAMEESTRVLLEGDPPPSRQEEAVIAGAILFRRLNQRRRGIAMLETQAVAEASKLTEAQVLVGLRPTAVPLPQVVQSLREEGQIEAAEKAEELETEVENTIFKTWVSMGDDRVRPAHLDADGQVRPVEEPFIVDGEELMEPGDTSLGASLENVINCRCSSVIGIDDVSSVRS